MGFTLECAASRISLSDVLSVAMNEELRELDHSRHLVLLGDFPALANAVHRAFVIVRRDFAAGHGRAINVLESKGRKFIAAFFPGVQFGIPVGARYPEIRNNGRARNRREAEVGDDAPGGIEAVGLEKVFEHPVGQLDMLDAGFRPALERFAVAGSGRSVLVQAESHFASSGHGAARQFGSKRSEERGSSREHAVYYIEIQWGGQSWRRAGDPEGTPAGWTRWKAGPQPKGAPQWRRKPDQRSGADEAVRPTNVTTGPADRGGSGASQSCPWCPFRLLRARRSACHSSTTDPVLSIRRSDRQCGRPFRACKNRADRERADTSTS